MTNPSDPTRCSSCGCQIRDPFGLQLVMHDVVACQGFRRTVAQGAAPAEKQDDYDEESVRPGYFVAIGTAEGIKRTLDAAVEKVEE